VSHVSWFFINAGFFLTAAYYSLSNIMNNYPRRVMYAFGFQFILMTLRVQLSGVTLDRFNPFRRTSILTWAVLSAHIIHVFLFGTSFMDESLMYLILSLMSFVSLLHFVVSVAGELR
jgi:hypothetical protein